MTDQANASGNALVDASAKRAGGCSREATEDVLDELNLRVMEMLIEADEAEGQCDDALKGGS